MGLKFLNVYKTVTLLYVHLKNCHQAPFPLPYKVGSKFWQLSHRVNIPTDKEKSDITIPYNKLVLHRCKRQVSAHACTALECWTKHIYLLPNQHGIAKPLPVCLAIGLVTSTFHSSLGFSHSSLGFSAGSS